MTTVCIMGAGDLGGATAHALARAGQAARVILVDERAAIAAGKALDIQQSGAIAGFHTQLSGTDDPARAIGAAVFVIADRAAHAAGEWHGDEGLTMLTRLAGVTGDAPLVFAGVLQGPLLLAAAREARIRRERLIGSTPEAFASAVTALVAVEARCSPAEVRLTVLGAPSGFVVPWSEASIGGYALERVLSQVQLTRLEARMARLWPPGPYALAAAAARVTNALVTSSRQAFAVLSVLGGEFGARDCIGSLPALLSTTGIVHTRVPTLSPRDRVKLETALGM